LGILRTILAIAVVVYHSYKLFGLRLCGGQVAVESFYMISGFYMALILNEKYIGLGSYKKFIFSRFYRIFPVYWIVLISVFLIALFCYFSFDKPLYLGRYLSNYDCLSGSTIAYFIFENIVVIGQDVMYFMKLDELCKPDLTYHVFSYRHTGYQYLLVPQAWSISIEFIFYLIAPFLVTKKIKWQVSLVLFGIGAKVFFANKYYLCFDPWTYRFFPFEIAYFIAGSLAYQFYKRIEFKEISNKIGTGLLLFCLVGVFVLSEIEANETLKNTVFYILCLCSLPFIFKAFKNNAIDRYIGELSFSIYISHHVLVSLFRGYFFTHTEYIPYYGYTVVACSLVLALLLQQTVIKRIENYRHKRFS
jgi:peptidoglycan/LPS O-acetylase OafA/YrhL